MPVPPDRSAVPPTTAVSAPGAALRWTANRASLGSGTLVRTMSSPLTTAVTWLAVALSIAALVVAVRSARARAPHAPTLDGEPFGASSGTERVEPGDDAASSLARLQTDLAASLRHVAVVRYDAFDDVTGRQSFSLAMLDDHGDGVVITSLASRTDARLFAKAVQSHSASGLTPEEQQAIDVAARGGQ